MSRADDRRPGRLARAQRRAHLLDVAAQMVLEGGFEALTMEGVAARAGVSKALPYQHFPNSDELLNALCEREERVVDERVGAAFEAGDSLEHRILSSMRAYFDVIQERGVILALIHHPLLAPRFRQSVLPAWQRRTDGMAAYLRRELGLSAETAAAAARIALAAVLGALSSWQHADASRELVERVAVELIATGLRAVGGAFASDTVSADSDAATTRSDAPAPVQPRSAVGDAAGR